MRIRNQKLRTLYEFIEKAVGSAYRHPWLAANPVLARSPHTGLIERHMSDDEPDAKWWLRVPKQLCLYFINNLATTHRFLNEVKALRQTCPAPNTEIEATTVVDTVLYLDEMRNSRQVGFWNMPGLAEAMRENGTVPILTPVLYGNMDEDNLRALEESVQDSALPVLLSHQLFNSGDALRLIAFIIGYPVLLLLFLLCRKYDDRPSRLLRDECVATLGNSVVQEYLRYLYGRGIARRMHHPLTVISWCENRAGDKLFYRGLRAGTGYVRIVGIQTFLFPDNYLGCYFNSSDILHGLTPDEVVVNGPYYLPDPPLLPSRVGLSMRYNTVFDLPVPDAPGEDTLILLSHNAEASHKLVEIIRETPELNACALKVRLHPSHPRGEWAARLPATATISDGPLIDSLKTARLVIGTETGAILEAIACGIPAISVDTIGHRSLGYMPDIGKNEVWFEAADPAQLNRCLAKANDVPHAVRQHYADTYRSELFNDPRRGDLLESFGL